MSEPLHIADKLVYTAVILYILAIMAGMIIQGWLPYEQAKRVEWWTETLAALPLVAALYFGVAMIFIAPFVMLYVVWFGHKS